MGSVLIGTAFAPSPYIFSFFRFIGGLGIGISSVVAPTYISEISTPATRGRLTALYQFNIVFGILVAFISNYLLQGVGGENDWRWMLGVLAIPSLLYTIMVVSVPESPRWLISVKNDLTKAAAVLAQIGTDSPQKEIEVYVDDMIAKSRTEDEHLVNLRKLFGRDRKSVV